MNYDKSENQYKHTGALFIEETVPAGYPQRT